MKVLRVGGGVPSRLGWVFAGRPSEEDVERAKSQDRR